MFEKERSVDIRSFNLPADKYHIGAGMFNGSVEVPSDMHDIPGHEYGCGLRSVAIVARLYLDHPSDETIVNTVSAAGYDKYWGMDNSPHVDKALTRLDLPHKPIEDMPMEAIIDELSKGSVAILNSTGPLWAHSDAPGESLFYRGDLGHLLVALKANKRTRPEFVLMDSDVAQSRLLTAREKRHIRLSEGRIETVTEDIAGLWAVDAHEFASRNWIDFKYSSKPDSGETVGISTCGDLIYPGVDWQERKGFLISRPKRKPYVLNNR